MKKNHGNLYNANINKISSNYIPLNEYPRPNLKRNNFFILNGFWDFEINKTGEVPTSFKNKILVPYAVESPLSNIHKLVEPTDYLIYQKSVVIPRGNKRKNIILHFNGVDQEASIYIDGKLLKKHNGISKFDVIFPFKNEFIITVVVRDYTDEKYYARGKQTLNPSGWFYSSSSGITKTVWLECVDDNYVKDIKYYPDYDHKLVKIIVTTDKEIACELHINEKKYKITTNKIETIKLDDFHPWSHKNPYLYNVKIKTNNDEVVSYFGIRKIEIQNFNGFNKVYLNNKPLFINGILDQGYYYLGDLTPTTYKDYEQDINNIKALGFNCLRVHAKVEDDVFYYYADKLGMLVIQDFVNGGYPYNFLQVVLPRVFPSRDYKYINEEKTGRKDEQSKQCFRQEADYYLQNFNNFPSVIIYTIFNEGWGEFEPDKIYEEIKEKDNNHLFDTASGWMDAPSDFFSVHTYTFPKMKRKNKYHRAFFISECGGLGLKDKEHSLFKGYYSHKSSYSKKSFTKKYCSLYLDKLLPQIKRDGLSGIVYTQVSDCEAEYNGLYTFDREILKIAKKVIQDINNKIYQEFEKSNE